jgi:glucosyl-3-phosphoglycerate synthase
LFKKILIPLIDPSRALPYLQLATALLPEEGKVLALKVVLVPEHSSLSEGAEKAPEHRAEMDKIEFQFSDERIELKTLVRVAHRLWEGITETVVNEGCDLLLLPWKGYTTSEDKLFGVTIDRLMERPPCRTLVVRASDFSGSRRFLLPVRGGPYAEFALELGSQLAKSLKADVTLLHCDTPSPEKHDNRPYLDFLQRLRFYPNLRRLLTVQGNPEQAIIDEAQRHDVVIVGAVAQAEPDGFFLGPIVERVAREMQKPLVVVKTPDAIRAWNREGLDRSKTLSERVDQWFAENTFQRREFSDLEKLLELKKKQQVTISLGLPALNEEETIGEIIRTVKKALLDDAPLLDEIVLIDSASTDDTVKIARDLGVPAYVHQEILPQRGSNRGKGEALWKSLYVLKGDIILWIDTDIKNIHPGFVYGLLGPLLRQPEIRYVKGFYRRPIKVGEELYAGGGGRVTELTARPFLNLFFPELSGIIQPLAGEYGGRREVLERVPFFTGYGVETGLLIDLYNLYGLSAIAQVDLEERIHRNQSLPALSQMSFAIIQVFMERLQERNRIELLEEVNRTMKLVKGKGNSYALEVKNIRDQERPPMVTIPEYRAKRQSRAAAGAGV